MADNFWDNSDLDNDPTVAANFSGGVPGSGDSVIYDDQYVAGTANMNGVTDQWGDIDVRNFTYNIGSSGTPFTQNVGNLTKLEWAGHGKGFFAISGVNITTVVARGTSIASDALNVSPGTCTDAYHSKGRLNWTGGTVTNFYQSFRNSPSADAICYCESAAVITNIYQTAGRMVYQGTSGPTIARIGGHAEFTDGAIATLDVDMGGTCVYKATGHTITLARVRGVLDLSATGVAVTVTDAIVYGGGVIKAGPNVTFSNSPIRIGSGQIIGQGTVTDIAY